MSNENDSKKSSNPKLSLRRETVKTLGVKTGVQTGRASGCTMDTQFSCNTSGPCTMSHHSIGVG